MEITSFVLGMLTIVATFISMSIVVGLTKINKLTRKTESLTQLCAAIEGDLRREIEDKNRIFIWFSLKFARESSQLDQDQLKDRCLRAATHNQGLLAAYQQKWPSDFQQWLVDLKRLLTNL